MKRGILGLTRCQEEALRLRCSGLQNKEVAERLFVDLSTIKNHLTATFRVLGLSGGARGDAACYRLGRADEQRREQVS